MPPRRQRPCGFCAYSSRGSPCRYGRKPPVPRTVARRACTVGSRLLIRTKARRFCTFGGRSPCPVARRPGIIESRSPPREEPVVPETVLTEDEARSFWYHENKTLCCRLTKAINLSLEKRIHNGAELKLFARESCFPCPC